VALLQKLVDQHVFEVDLVADGLLRLDAVSLFVSVESWP